MTHLLEQSVKLLSPWLPFPSQLTMHIDTYVFILIDIIYIFPSYSHSLLAAYQAIISPSSTISSDPQCTSIVLPPHLPLHLHYVSHILLWWLELYPREVVLRYFQCNLTVVIIYLFKPVSVKECDWQFTRRLMIWLGVLQRLYTCYMLCPQPWKDIGWPPPLVINHLDILANVAAPHQYLDSIYSPCAIGICIIWTHPISLVPQ